MEKLYQIFAGVDKSTKDLYEYVRQWVEEKTCGDFHAFERKVKKMLDDIGTQAIEAGLCKFDLAVEKIEVHGKVYERTYRLPETYYSMFGKIRIERNIYSATDRNTPSICPLEIGAGIIEGAWTPGAAELMAYSTGVMTPYDAEKFFRKLGGALTPSRSSFDRLTKYLSGKWEKDRVCWEGIIRSQQVCSEETATVAVSLDGIMVPMKDGNRLEKRAEALEKGKETRGPAGCREAGCGTVSIYNKEGERRDTIYYGRMPESKKCTLHSQLGKEVAFMLADNLSASLVAIADGSKDNWRIFDDIIKSLKDSGTIPQDKANVYKIADFYHACEHLKSATDLYYGEKSVESRAHFAELRVILKEQDDGVDRIVRKIEYFRNHSKGKRRKKLTTELEYFRTRILFMAYAEFERMKLPIGSGVVEAACKTLVTQRMKRSGMRWEIFGGQSVLTLRSLLLSDRWEEGWALIAKTYQPYIRIIKEKEQFTLIENFNKAA